MATAYPIALHLEHKACLVIGSNAEAVDRALALLRVGAHVTLITPMALTGLELERVRAAQLEPLVRAYEDRDLDGQWLAVLTDRDEQLGARIAEQALSAGTLFCATDQQQANSYSHMSLTQAGCVTLAISTNGRAPALARRLRLELERVFDAAGLAEFADALAELRARTPPEQRKAVLSAAVAALKFDGELLLPKV